jgi:hypothetical protein
VPRTGNPAGHSYMEKTLKISFKNIFIPVLLLQLYANYGFFLRTFFLREPRDIKKAFLCDFCADNYLGKLKGITLGNG